MKQTPIRIMFICHGNICRSPMAESVFRELVRQNGYSDRFRIASSATSCEELGNPVYPPAQRILRQHNVPFDLHHAARRFSAKEYPDWDLLICMDQRNLRNLAGICPDPEKKVRLLMEYAGEHRDVADPWYTGDFEETWDDIEKGCRSLLRHLLNHCR